MDITKEIAKTLQHIQSVRPDVISMQVSPDLSTYIFDPELPNQQQLQQLVLDFKASDDYALDKIKFAVERAILFGQSIIAEFAAENVLLGITEASMTNQVRKVTMQVTSALNTGALYDAIAECRAIPEEDKDDVFITNDRLLTFINKIEEYLGIPLSEEF
jgi:hypothetical protein